MLDNPVKRMIKRGDPAFGVYISWPSPDLVEFCGHLGFDWVFIDAEHGCIGREMCADMVRACNLVGLVPIVRVPESNPGTILSYLETGALGIIVPHVNGAADARAAVNSIRYAPEGNRGAGSTTRVSNYGLTQTAAEYFRKANEELLVITLVEEVEGIRNLEAILGVQGVDAAAIGPGDLANTLGLPGQPGHPEVQALVTVAEAKIIASGKALVPVCKDANDVRAAVDRGAKMPFVSAASLLAGAGRALLAEVRR
jgi:2-keto-3-deoxy-L-rhamnonate aldolase RhmA